MEKNKTSEYLDYIIKEIEDRHVVCEVKGENREERVTKKIFLDPNDLVVGETWRCYKNSKNNKYSYFSNLFSQEYLKSKFKDNNIYEGYIHSEILKEWIVKVEKDAYIKIPKDSFFNKVEIGDNVRFSIVYTRSGRVKTDLNRPILMKICNELSANGTDKIKLQIVNIGRKTENEADFDRKPIGFEYTLFWEEDNTYFKLFLKGDLYDRINNLEDNTYYLERNYEIFLGAKANNLKKYAYFKFDRYTYERGKYFFYLDILDLFKEELQKEIQIAKLVFYEGNFYIERYDIGTFKFNTSRYSLVELNLLETLHDKYVCLELVNDRLINLLPIVNNDEIEEEMTDVIIANRITTFSKRIIYQLTTNDPNNEKNYRMFVEDRDINYSGELLPEGYILDKIAFKYNVKNMFAFYTRLPYIENPLIEFLKDRKEGDTIYARVKKVENTYIEIIIDGKYRKIIPQEKLKKLESFNIGDYYEVDKLAEFYIESMSKEDVSLLGYNPEKIKNIFDAIKAPYEDEEGEILECHVQEGASGLDGVYEEKGEFLEVNIPNNEISFLGLKPHFDPKIKYQFKVIGKGLPNNPYGLLLSRKRLSKSIKNELESLYPIGSTIGGVFFLKDKEGFYLNLVDKDYNMNMGDLIGYLPFNKLGLYPNVEAFKRNLISNTYNQYRILKYPKKFNSLNIREKAVELDILTPVLNLKDIVNYIGSNSVILDLSRRNTLSLLSSKEEKLYFEKEIKGEIIVFSLEKSEYNLLENLYTDFESRKEEPIYQKLFALFETPRIVELSFIGVDESNNTIELSIQKRIEKLLLESDTKFKHNSDDILLFGDKILNLPIVIENQDFVLNKEQEYRIKNIVDRKVILEVLFNENDLLGKEYRVKIVEKTEEGYIGKVGDRVFIIDSTYELGIDEKVICESKRIKEGKIYGELKIVEELTNNCGVYINEYLKANIRRLSLEDLKEIIKKDDEKCKYVDLLNKYKAEIFTGYKLDNYLFSKKEFSNGAFGKIYKGADLVSGKNVILKRYCSDKTVIEYKSFQSEAKLLQELDLPYVMRVFYSTEDEYVGEYIEGKTFRAFLKEKHSFEEKLECMIKIARVLDEIHQIPVYHLDIKPENIMIDKSGDIKLIDFGGSQSKYEEYGKFGTLIYSSPKQCMSYSYNILDTKFSDKDDMYSFGILMYETFVGKPPYSSELGDDGIIAGHKRGREVDEDVEYRYKNPREVDPNIPEELEIIINRCLEREEEERYDIMLDVVDELEKCL